MVLICEGADLYRHELRDTLSKIINGDIKSAEKDIELIEDRLAHTYDKSMLLPIYFVNAIRKRIEGSSWKVPNLYLLNDSNQQMSVFNFMANQFPLVSYVQKIANEAIANVMKGERSVLLLDVGIGTGLQIERMIQEYYSSNGDLPLIKIIGIEPSIESKNKLLSRVKTLENRYNINIDLVTILSAVEDLSDQDWLNIRRQVLEEEGPLIANASFSLHHTPLLKRDEVLHNIYNLKPDLFVITEPDADYLIDDMLLKYDNAWDHYERVFHVIDQIDVDETNKNMVKTIFFGREIQDVLSTNSVELYETAFQWTSRLENIGFSNINTPVVSEGILSEIESSGLCSLVANESHLTIEVRNKPVVSVMMIA
ncbi:MAG: GRAS family protein [Candidatus Melainabacteria bacterium]